MKERHGPFLRPQSLERLQVTLLEVVPLGDLVQRPVPNRPDYLDARVLVLGRHSEGDVEVSPFAVLDTEPRLQQDILNTGQEEKFGTARRPMRGIRELSEIKSLLSDRHRWGEGVFFSRRKVGRPRGAS